MSALTRYHYWVFPWASRLVSSSMVDWEEEWIARETNFPIFSSQSGRKVVGKWKDSCDLNHALSPLIVFFSTFPNYKQEKIRGFFLFLKNKEKITEKKICWSIFFLWGRFEISTLLLIILFNWYSECRAAFWDMECRGSWPSDIEGSQWGHKGLVISEMVLQGLVLLFLLNCIHCKILELWWATHLMEMK